MMPLLPMKTDLLTHFLTKKVTLLVLILLFLVSAVMDAGTEVNDEMPVNAAGVGLPEMFMPDTGVDEDAAIHQHPGYIRGGNILSNPMFANADFTTPGYQIARIKIEAVSVPPQGCIYLS